MKSKVNDKKEWMHVKTLNTQYNSYDQRKE